MNEKETLHEITLQFNALSNIHSFFFQSVTNNSSIINTMKSITVHHLGHFTMEDWQQVLQKRTHEALDPVCQQGVSDDSVTVGCVLFWSSQAPRVKLESLIGVTSTGLTAGHLHLFILTMFFSSRDDILYVDELKLFRRIWLTSTYSSGSYAETPVSMYETCTKLSVATPNTTQL